MAATPGRLAVLAGLLAAAALPAQTTRYHQLTKKFASPPDRATVVAAGHLGGPGTEWLAAGGFQPDGTVVVAGVSLGPTLALGGAKVTVLGKDAPAPEAPEPRVRQGPDGRPVIDRRTGRVVYDPFGWDHDSATAFVARLSPDLQKVLSVSRFPWRAGGVTGAAVDDAGRIYLTGPAGPALGSLDANQAALPHRPTGLKWGVASTYVCALAPDAGKVLWVRTIRGPSDAPALGLAPGGKLRYQGADLRTLTAEGKQEAHTVVPGGLTTRPGSTAVRTTAVHPTDGTFVRAGEALRPTGREQHRGPTLEVYRPGGTLLYELYNWDGPLVGMDGLRLVSDSAVRQARYDQDGNLLLCASSEGANSVLLREPNDVRRPTGRLGGLGMTVRGQGAFSCAYLIKVETKNYKVTGGTVWMAYQKDADRPSSIWIDSLGTATDGSVCFAGRSAWGLIQTGNAIGKEPAGPYVAVVSKDCTSLRFSSAMPGCGATDVRDGARWGIVQGTQKGRPVALFLGGAGGDAPQVRPPQAAFGGGHSDGYLLLLDLSAPGKGAKGDER